MMTHTVVPQLAANSFNCPHCGALAHQSWLAIWAKHYALKSKPSPSMIGNPLTGKSSVNRDISSFNVEKPQSVNVSVSNLNLSSCFSCKKYSVWLADQLIHPAHSSPVQPHEDMPQEILQDFREAAQIVDISPRGASALLRLALQKLMPVLGASGKNLNDDIRSLVKQGLDPRVQRALDVLRVVGNNAVHPGVIDLNDDKATALRLFDALNVIVVAMISSRRQIDDMYEALPKGAREAIEKQDGNPA